MLQVEDRLISFLKSAKNYLSINLYEVQYPKGSQPRDIYRLVKTHKALFNKFAKFRLTLSAMNTHTYDWPKFFILLERNFALNGYILLNLFYCSFFKNILLEEAVNIYIGLLFN